MLRLSETTTSKGYGSGKEGYKFQRGVKPLPLQPKTKKQVVYGLAQCWLLISREVCGYCILQAGTELHKLCPYKQGDCLLKYSNADFIGTKDVTN